MKALITTTINVPEVLTKWATTMTMKDIIIVAGDHKSPHGAIQGLLTKIKKDTGVQTVYLDPNDQTHWEVSEHLGWNCVQRRNIALLEALKLKPDYVITIDDDNAPTTTDQLSYLESLFEESADIRGIRSPDGWYDAAGEQTDAVDAWGFNSPITHRGYPQKFRFADVDIEEISDTTEWPIGVAAMLWRGEPDIDAAERFTHRPFVNNVASEGVKLLPGTWCPFNSQATMFRGDLAPLMFVWPHVGRYDDIWASYLARRVMDHLGYSVYYGHPIVDTTVRNEHDIIKDLNLEMMGMTHNQEVIDVLRSVDFTHLRADVTPTQLWLDAHMTLESALSHMLPTQTFNAFSTFLGDLQSIGIE